ncbi:MAG: hypothetical protein IT430_02310 [Phycisphaerales bacterium]|nr:hypothetical protein [Phycisphaerales bacterium]
MATATPSCPATRSKVIELYFMEHRAKVLDLAAFLDRLDRASDDLGHEDFRVAALKEAMRIVLDGKGERAKRVLDHFSDPTDQPLESAAGMKGAFGVYPGVKRGAR